MLLIVCLLLHDLQMDSSARDDEALVGASKSRHTDFLHGFFGYPQDSGLSAPIVSPAPLVPVLLTVCGGTAVSTRFWTICSNSLARLPSYALNSNESFCNSSCEVLACLGPVDRVKVASCSLSLEAVAPLVPVLSTVFRGTAVSTQF
ncbi:hypothetical protein BDR26DRAFT_995104 [Obelidium mucronatum]|nr:hypothetical protein BDR26DRAFT_995104 [Obelidium mucronatum]